MKSCSLLLLAAMIAAPAWAAEEADGPAGGQVISLTPEQKEQLLGRNTEADADAALRRASGGGGSESADASPARVSGAGAGGPQIHGEAGFMIGTGGARGVFGTAAVPLGENAGAIISFENTRLPRGRVVEPQYWPYAR
ncbi:MULTISPECIES: hypothetical protein [Sphingomonadales]|nr:MULTISPECIES: hypothetical protein [Sphingomonas]MDX3885897.1 hypothetical protein [Sphingomonas sp.]OHT21951.1 hypothetical protein BHE75_03966 [Sphingomonas haloaromaticamans]